MLHISGENPAGFAMPLPSTAHRSVAVTSKAHFCGHVVIGDGSGRGAVSGSPARIVQVESHLELCWCLCLSIRPDIADLREQVGFEWFDEDGVRRTHYFDLFVTRTDGSRIACAVRPAARVGGRFGRQMPQIASQLRESRFADDLRLLTDADLDPVELHNAWLLHAIRAGDPEADTMAAQVLSEMSGTPTLAELTDRTGFGAAGFRALLRLVRSGHLHLLRAERITRTTAVYKGNNL
ncbi:hypothetical protein [Paracoccus saliphilus]|uniref:Uncharacterized protein n=1 Tax=Paracoccus saliphilus TaxID=405559 RepID=A0AA45W7X5_9RHOB|nr:hypothetical protein [Paracoccus saliphilus]WCR04802.1 hypothetical protein JHX88_08860 [Paracoccus saliphilus]SIT12782.1 hypothetical protein SAMN05421772_12211 [Paracoccus saliphilus]